MKKERNYKLLLAGIATVIVFILWTVAISIVEIQAIGPKGSSVGFATVNRFVHNLTGVHMELYKITEWLG